MFQKIRRRDEQGEGRDGAWLMLLAVIALALLPVLAHAQDPAPTPSPSPGLNDGPFTVSLEAGAIANLTGTDDTSIKPTTWIDADMPLGYLVAHARLGLTSRPGENVDLTSVESWQDAELGIALRKYLRCYEGSCVGIGAEAGFSTATSQATQDDQPLNKLSRYAGIGAVFKHTSGAEFSLLWGNDEQGGTAFGWGDLIAYGRLPVPSTKGIVILNGDVLVNLGARTERDALPELYRDVWKMGVTLDLGQAFKAIGGNGGADTDNP